MVVGGGGGGLGLLWLFWLVFCLFHRGVGLTDTGRERDGPKVSAKAKRMKRVAGGKTRSQFGKSNN